MQRGDRRIRLRLTVAGLAAVLCLGGCSSSDELTPAGELGASAAARHPLAASPAVALPADQLQLAVSGTVTGQLVAAGAPAPTRRPRRRPPGWIQRIFANYKHDWCTTIPAGATGSRIEATRLEKLHLCAEGYTESTPADLVITAPNGERIEPAAVHDGFGWAWDFQPGAEGDRLTEVGTYRFDMTGKPANGGPEPLVTSGSIVVRHSLEPRVAFADDRGQDQLALWPGQSVRVRMAGYLPGRTVSAALYRKLPGRHPQRFLAHLPYTRVDSFGEGTLRWAVPAGIAPGSYGIWIEMGPDSWDGCDRAGCGFFQVGG